MIGGVSRNLPDAVGIQHQLKNQIENCGIEYSALAKHRPDDREPNKANIGEHCHKPG